MAVNSCALAAHEKEMAWLMLCVALGLALRMVAAGKLPKLLAPELFLEL